MDLSALPAGARILNLGAGMGEDLSVIASYGTVHVVDKEPEALKHVPEDLVAEKINADICDLSYPEGSFDAVLAFDVLEHIKDDGAAVNAICRLLKPAGVFVFTVPALAILFSLHDRTLGHHRRYGRENLMRLLEPFRIERMGYWMSLLLPILALQRLVERNSTESNSSANAMPTFINSALYRVLTFENTLIRLGIPLPIGATLFGVCRKHEAVS